MGIIHPPVAHSSVGPHMRDIFWCLSFGSSRCFKSKKSQYVMITPPSGDDDGLSQSGEGRRDEGRRSVCPSDPVESLNAFTRKVGAFVNKPSTQVSDEAF